MSVIIQLFVSSTLILDGLFSDKETILHTFWAPILGQRLSDIIQRCFNTEIGIPHLNKTALYQTNKTIMMIPDEFGGYMTLGSGSYTTLQDASITDCDYFGSLIHLEETAQSKKVTYQDTFDDLCLKYHPQGRRMTRLNESLFAITPYRLTDHKARDWTMSSKTWRLATVYLTCVTVFDLISSNFWKKNKSRWLNGRNWLLMTFISTFISQICYLTDMWTIGRCLRIMLTGGSNSAVTVTILFGGCMYVGYQFFNIYLTLFIDLFTGQESAETNRANRYSVFSIKYYATAKLVQFEALKVPFIALMRFARKVSKFRTAVKLHSSQMPDKSFFSETEMNEMSSSSAANSRPNATTAARDIFMAEHRARLIKTVPFGKQVDVLRAVAVVGYNTTARSISVRFGGNSLLEPYHFKDWINQFNRMSVLSLPCFLLKTYMFCSYGDQASMILLAANCGISYLNLISTLLYLTFDKKLWSSWMQNA